MTRLGKRAFAWMYHHLLSGEGRPDPSDPFTRDVRMPLIARAQGDVLEIGAGDGGNLSLYPSGVRLTLLEPNPFMIAYLEEACAARNGDCLSVIEGQGERLPFPDRHFDTVVTTHVLCSVGDQPQVLREVRRVLRPGGLFLFLEHVAAQPHTPPLPRPARDQPPVERHRRRLPPDARHRRGHPRRRLRLGRPDRLRRRRPRHRQPTRRRCSARVR